MLSTVLYYELAMKVPIPVGITVYLLTWGLGHLRCLVIIIYEVNFTTKNPRVFLSPRLKILSWECVPPVSHQVSEGGHVTFTVPGIFCKNENFIAARQLITLRL